MTTRGVGGVVVHIPVTGACPKLSVAGTALSTASPLPNTYPVVRTIGIIVIRSCSTIPTIPTAGWATSIAGVTAPASTTGIPTAVCSLGYGTATTTLPRGT